MADLTTLHCQPLEGQPPFTADAITAHLTDALGWALVDGAIEKRFNFADYHQTMAFVNAVAGVANAEDHHPDMVVSYGHCTVRFNTHSVGGISINDFICAAKVDALIS